MLGLFTKFIHCAFLDGGGGILQNKATHTGRAFDFRAVPAEALRCTSTTQLA